MAVALLLLFFCLLQAQNKKWRPINISIWNPVAIVPFDSLNVSNINLGFCSKTNRLNGLSANVFANFCHQDLNGLLFTGGYNFLHKDMNGLEIAGLFNVVKGHMHGLQISAIQNTVVRYSKGLMICGITNFSVGDTKGIQLAGMSNIAGSRASGIQFAGGINIASSSSRLFQLAGLVNVCEESIKGVQLGLANYAGGVRGVQLGLINICGDDVKGVQIGLINHSSDTSTVKLGLVNVNPKTRIQMLFYSGNVNKINLGIRFKAHYTYSILGFGTSYKGLDDKFSGSLFYRLGVGIKFLRVLEISSDAGFYHIQNFEKDGLNGYPKRLYSLQGRLNLELHPISKLGIFASGGFAQTRRYGTGVVFENRPIMECGIVLF